MKVSSIDVHSIIGQGIVNGRLATEFRANEINPRGGTLICEPAVDSSQTADEGDHFYSMTVTRHGRKFWDEGNFTPRI